MKSDGGGPCEQSFSRSSYSCRPARAGRRTRPAVGLLESCRDESVSDADELRRAERGDHVRLVFAEPVAVAVLGEKVKVSELVFRLPVNTGVFWVRAGDTWRRYSKYEFRKEKPLAEWLREARPD
jgi:hypothetical protein